MREGKGIGPHLLHWFSFDAVAVVLAYQWVLSRWTGIDVPAHAYVLLGVGIWLGYTADRLLDVRRDPELARRSRRHAFHARHQGGLQAGWVGLFLLAGAGGAALLSPRTLIAGLAVAGLAALYVLGVCGLPLLRKSGPRGRVKPLLTALLLTMAGGWWIWSSDAGPGPAGWSVMTIFAAAAWCNLVLLRRARVRPPSRWSMDRIALVADGTLALGLVLMGAVFP